LEEVLNHHQEHHQLKKVQKVERLKVERLKIEEGSEREEHDGERRVRW
jgi:hypothetical protein